MDLLMENYQLENFASKSNNYSYLEMSPIEGLMPMYSVSIQCYHLLFFFLSEIQIPVAPNKQSKQDYCDWLLTLLQLL